MCAEASVKVILFIFYSDIFLNQTSCLKITVLMNYMGKYSNNAHTEF